MIHAVTAANRAQYARQIDEMHQIRHRVYVEERGWKGLSSTNGREIDEYDDDAAVYLLGLCPSGAVLGGVRLRRTDRGSLLSDHFSRQVRDPLSIPSSPDVWEMTRWFQVEKERGAGPDPAAIQSLCAMFEFGLARNVKEFTLTCDSFFLPRLIRVGWRITHMGLPFDYGEGTAIVVRFPCDWASLRNTREVCRIHKPLLFEGAVGMSLSPEPSFENKLRLFELIDRLNDPETQREAVFNLEALISQKKPSLKVVGAHLQ